MGFPSHCPWRDSCMRFPDREEIRYILVGVLIVLGLSLGVNAQSSEPKPLPTPPPAATPPPAMPNPAKG